MTPEKRRFLEYMRQLLEKGWTQNKFAEDYDGYQCSPHNPHAAKFCMFGAALRAEEELHLSLPLRRRALSNLFGFGTLGDLMHWNDAPGRTQAEVLAKIDAALAREAQ